jgi:hypothetical protein
MKIGITQNRSYFNQAEKVSQNRGTDKKDTKNESKEKTSIYAGDLNPIQDNVAFKKQTGKKQAIRTLLQTFVQEMKMDENLEGMRSKQDNLLDEMKVYNEKVDSLQQMREGLRKGYSVSESSEEEKDVNLLIKGMKNPESLTNEEKKRLESIGSLTDYQKEVLECSKVEIYWSNKHKNAQDTIHSISQSVNSVKIERGKSNPVLDAAETAEEILDITSKEIIGMLLEETKQNIDEMIDNNGKTEEEAEKAKGDAEEASETGDMNELMDSYSEKQEEILKKLKKLKNQTQISSGLLEELKGIFLDIWY